MTDHDTAHAEVDALLNRIADLGTVVHRHTDATGLPWVPEDAIPEPWLSLFDERHPGSLRLHQHDGEPMISATTLYAFLQDIDALVGLHSLGLDLDRPGPAVDLPTLEDWFPAIVPGKTEELALIGTVIGHPRLRDGRTIVTSNLVVLNVDAGLARTMSRWYRLGERSNIAKLLNQPGVAVRLGIRQPSDNQARQMLAEVQYRVAEATAYIVRAGLLETENR